jgi:5'-nucleotidase
MSMAQRPLLLVTNDDGIDSLGLAVLVEALAEVGEVLVAAPDREQSAVGHSVSLSRPLRVNERGPGRFAISGTPVDAVLLSLFGLCPRPPSLVVSGINHGPNLGTDVLYSGTVAGALEGAIHDVPGLAVSQELPTPAGEADGALRPLFERTARFAARLARAMIADSPGSRVAFNVNGPARESEAYAWTRLGPRLYREQVERRLDLRGAPYYWIGGPPLRGVGEPGTDAHAVEAGMISVTPLDLDLTAPIPREGFGRWSPAGFQRIEALGPELSKAGARP